MPCSLVGPCLVKWIPSGVRQKVSNISARKTNFPLSFVHTISLISFGKSNTLRLLYEISCFATLCGQLGQGGLSGILSIGEKYLASHTKSLSALSLFVNLGNSEESLVSVLAAATLALLCFAIDPRQSDIHTALGFQQNSFPSCERFDFSKIDAHAEDDSPWAWRGEAGRRLLNSSQ